MATSKIQLAVAELTKRNLFALVIPTADPHNSEYVAPCFQRRAKLCGFQGSAGTCVVTTDSAALMWTDGRYWLEAEQTLDAGWKLMKQGDAETPTIEEWLQSACSSHIAKNKSSAASAKIGIDASTQLWVNWRRLVEAGLDVVPTEGNLVDTILNEGGKPAVPPVVKESVIALPEKYSGRSTADKIAEVAKELQKIQADVTVLSALDEVAWLLNLRCPSCCDIPFAPTFFAFAVVSSSGECHVFVDQDKFSADAKESLKACVVDTKKEILFLHPYTALPSWLAENKGKDIFSKSFNNTAVIAETSASFECYRLLTEAAGLKVRGIKAGIVEKLKAVKNDVELAGFRESHVRDGVALTRYLSWLHTRLNKHGGQDEQGKPVTETSGMAKLLSFREKGDKFLYRSFESISAAGGNAAVVHYRADEENPVPIKVSDMYLVDSGGQYLDGTTDVTRTVVFTTPEKTPKHWREAYTLVLKGHIRINSTVFPAGTSGHQLDCLARLDLWRHGLNYKHGTGHGVGHCLNVHEGPHGIGFVYRASDSGLVPGCVLSNEPGFYLAGAFGIRIENLEVVLPTPVDGPRMFGCAPFGSSCKLDHLTMVPMCRALIAKDLLSSEEVEWINAYHRLVFKHLAPRVSQLEEAESVMEFLLYECAPL